MYETRMENKADMTFNDKTKTSMSIVQTQHLNQSCMSLVMEILKLNYLKNKLKQKIKIVFRTLIIFL